MLDVSFQDKAYYQNTPAAGVRWTVDRLTWRAVGGPWSAQLTARATGGGGGAQAALWALTSLLRCGVEVRDPGGLAWWGYVATVSVAARGWTARVSLDKMSNKVAVIYNQLSPNPYTGPKTWSAWVEDSDSVSQYGRKVGVYDLGAATPTDAARAAAGRLAEHGRPLATVSPSGGGGLYATLECRGWWETLNWEYYEELKGWEGNTESGTALSLGSAAATTKIAQSFSTATGWPLAEVWLRARRYRAADNLVVEVYDNGAGVPGPNLLGTVSIAAGLLSDESNWYKAKLAAPVNLTAGTTYWVVVSRSGAISAADYYLLSADEKLGYLNGEMRIWNGGAWVARVPDADLGFILLGEDETSAILEEMIGSGQFLTGCTVEGDSGRKGRIYRDGTRRLREEAEELLGDGNYLGLRYLASVEPGRRVRVYTQPWRVEGFNAQAETWLGVGGYLTDRNGRLVLGSSRPWGKWAALGEAGAPVGVASVFAESVIFDGQGLRIGEV